MSWKSKRTRRDQAVRPAPGARPRTLPQYQRETFALLLAGHNMGRSQALSVLARWRGFVRESWKRGKPPCWTSDHLAKYARAHESPLPGGYRRDLKERASRRTWSSVRRRTFVVLQHDQVKGWFWTHGAAMAAAKRIARRTGAPVIIGDFRPGVRAEDRYQRVMRDAPGDIYESRAGVRWEVISVDDGKVRVKRLGMREVGPLIWKKSVLQSMRKAGHERTQVGSGPAPVQQSLFGPGVLAPDPRRRRR